MKTKQKWLKRTLTKLLCFVMVFGMMPAMAFATPDEVTDSVVQMETSVKADENEDKTVSESTSVADAMTLDEVASSIEGVDSQDVNTGLNAIDSAYVVEGSTGDIVIPENPKDGVDISLENSTITMNLPKSIGAEEGELVDGSVIYDDDASDVACAVQTLETSIEDAYALRALVVIENADAPREYDFSFSLPKGYKIIRGEDYKNSKECEKGALYVVNNNEMMVDELTGEKYPDSVLKIEPAWAKDANGNSINTYYKIRGNKIVQVVDFDETSAFPIVADPQLGGYYYTKTGVSYSHEWSNYKQSSAIINSKGVSSATITVTKSQTFSGSISGNIKGIVTIGTGTTISNSCSYSWTIPKNKRAYVGCRAKYRVEKGTRQKRLSSNRVVGTNKYTVKKVLGKNYREFKVIYK